MRDRQGVVNTGTPIVFLFCLLLAPPAAFAARSPAALVWPQPPAQARFQFVAQYASSDDVEKGFSLALRRFVLGKDAGGVRLKLPYGVAVDSKGRLLVADYGTGSIAVFDRANHKAYYLGDTDKGILSGPVGVAVDGADNVYVADSKLARIFKFSSNGEVLYSIGAKPTFLTPSGLGVDNRRDRLYVVDTEAHQVLIFKASTGDPIGTFGKRTKDPGGFNFPTNLWVDAKTGNLWVSDTMNFRVELFTPEGKLVRTFGESGDRAGSFARSRGLALDSEGHLYVVDAAFNNFQVFTQNGDLLLWVGESGTQAGQFNSPAGIFIDKKNQIYVVDRLNARVEVFQFLGGS